MAANRKAGEKTTGALTPVERCPICRAAAVDRHRPFCSSRCANIDLNRWLTGQYAIPVTEDDDEDGGPPLPGEDG